MYFGIKHVKTDQNTGVRAFQQHLLSLFYFAKLMYFTIYNKNGKSMKNHLDIIQILIWNNDENNFSFCNME